MESTRTGKKAEGKKKKELKENEEKEGSTCLRINPRVLRFDPVSREVLRYFEFEGVWSWGGLGTGLRVRTLP